MKGKKLLAAFLLGVGLCFVTALGYGEIAELWKEAGMESFFTDARIDYIMRNPTNFLYVYFCYDEYGIRGEHLGLPETVDTKDRIVIDVGDTRGVFHHKSEAAMLRLFKEILEDVYGGISLVATDLDADVVAVFYTKEQRLGYFYQGEYHLWED